MKIEDMVEMRNDLRCRVSKCPGVSGPCPRQFPESPSRGQSPTTL
ncbi:hypothetical protein [Candidatus Contubernalis alkaliaceticus]|nr:hypothetical protein [Candidatus Contubernalis alkalaceticus]